MAEFSARNFLIQVISVYHYKILIASIFFGLNSVALAKSQDGWIFVGYRIANHAGPPKTYNKIPTEFGYVWLKKDKTYSEAKKALKAKIRTENKGAYVDFYFASPSSYNLVGIYKIRAIAATWKGPKLEVTKYNIYRGKTREAIEKKVAADSKQWKYISAEPVKWITLSDHQQKLVSEIFAREARNKQGSDDQQEACHTAIAIATQKAEKECTVSKQGELVNLKSSKKESVEYEIPAGQNDPVKRVEQCRACKQSQSNEWFCTAKVTLRCQYEAMVEGTSMINRLRGEAQKINYTETDNPCVEDTQTKACHEYRQWKKQTKSVGGIRN